MNDAAIDVLEGELAEICGQLNVLHARLVAKVATALESGDWFQYGIHTPAQWLAWQTGLSPGRAREIVRVARARSEFPTVFTAFEGGELAVDQVAAATRAPAWTDAQMATLAKHATVQQLAKVVRSYRFDDPPHPQDDPEPEAPCESVAAWFDSAGRYHLKAELEPDHGRVVDAALAAAKDTLFHAAALEQRRQVSNVDALVEVATRSLDATAEGRRERFRVNLYIDTTAAIVPRDGVTWSDGTAVPDWIRDLIVCDAAITPIRVHDGVPVSVGRAQRIVPDRTRRLIEHRDRGCRVPGCGRSRHLQVHHIVHDLAGGGCDTWNLICLCPHHHRLHHQGRLGITGNADDPNGMIFTDAHGRPLPRSGTPRQPTGPPPQPDRPYQHPLGERLDLDAIYFNPPTSPVRHGSRPQNAAAAREL